MADESTPKTENVEEAPTEEPESVDVDTKEESTPKDAEAKQDSPDKQSKFKRLLQTYKGHKKVAVPLTALAVLLVVLALPFTRYKVLGLFIKKQFNVVAIDSSTNTPVSNASVTIAGHTAQTDGNGKASIGGVPVGQHTLTATKKYYKDYSGKVMVPLAKVRDPFQIKMVATGRQVPVVVSNKITGKGVEGVTITANDVEARTDKDGKATVVLPADQQKVDAKLTLQGYNDAAVSITITDRSVKENTFTVIPSGKVYFLSKASGKIDVVKTNLDGSGRQTVLAGTGKEEDRGTILLASRDWKYLALLSRRDGGQPKLYLIDTSTDKLSTMDEGDAIFGLVGWDNEYFVFTVARNKDVWADKINALKAYNAKTAQIKTLDETAGEGTGNYDYAAENFGTVSIANSSLVYSKAWNSNYYSMARLSGKKDTIISIKPDGTDKQTLKSFDVSTDTSYSYIDTRLNKPDDIYFQVSASGPISYYEYQNGKLAEAKDVNADSFGKDYPTYLISPDGKASFWSEPRDGKNTLFVGNQGGELGKQIASLSEYLQYGWYTNDYLLVSKNGSELYIMPVGGGTPLKLSDYHKPTQSFNSYGGGYGGF
jgi:hypothetical protein